MEKKEEIIEIYQELSDKVKEAITRTIKNFKEYQHIDALVLLEIKGDDRLSMLPFPPQLFDSKGGKAILGMALKKFVKTMEQDKNKDILNVIMISEVWMGEAHQDDKETINEILKGPVREYKDRKEGIMFSIESKADDKMLFYEIIRNNNDNVVISDYPVAGGKIKKGEPNSEITSVFKIW